MNKFSKSLLVTALTAVGMSSVHAAVPVISPCVEDHVGLDIMTCSNKFVMLNPAGGVTGANDVSFGWDGTYNTNVGTAVDNAALAPVAGATFFGYTWTAHNVQVFSGAPTTYSFHGGVYPSVTVGVGQVALVMLFDWGATVNIPVVEICEPGATGGGFSGTGYADSTVWDCVSVDGNGDGIRGIPMANGPFTGFNANFNLMGLTPPGVPALYGTVSTVVRPSTITGGAGGGGCAMDPAGRDISLLFSLLGGLGYTSWRRRRS